MATLKIDFDKLLKAQNFQELVAELGLDELNDVLQSISNYRDALREKALEIRAVRDHKAAVETARVKLAAMSDAEKAVLVQELKLTGIQAGSVASSKSESE
ncbi:MAG: hypothetical protein MOB07_23305 [Acidobacteria bacterium]|nr:hypothetical protein [Acidobacteriota bacterium]